MHVRHAHGTLDVSTALIMGVVNASPESFSDSGASADRSRSQRVDHALQLAAAGATILDIGGQSARTDEDEIPVGEEIERVVPLIQAIRAHSDVVISVDTYRPEVADAALHVGADIVNDISNLRDEHLADVLAHHGAGVVLMHNRLPPKIRMSEQDRRHFTSPASTVDAVVQHLSDSIKRLGALGVSAEQVVVDPGPDFAKTPAQTVAVLRQIDRVAALDRPVLLALSRKDFIGAATDRSPAARGAGTLAAIGFCLDRCPHAIVRVHDVAATRDYLAVRDLLFGRTDLDWEVPIADRLRYEPRS